MAQLSLSYVLREDVYQTGMFSVPRIDEADLRRSPPGGNVDAVARTIVGIPCEIANPLRSADGFSHSESVFS
jgi:hypothetical protein